MVWIYSNIYIYIYTVYIYTCIVSSVLISEPPDYHPGARHFDIEKRSKVGPTVPPSEAILDSLAQEWSDRDYAEAERGGGGRGKGGGDGESMWSKSAPGSSISIPSEHMK